MDKNFELMLKKEDMLTKAYQRAVSKLVERYAYDQILENPEILEKYVPERVGTKIKNWVGKFGKSASRIWMISINPESMDSTDDERLKLFVKCVKKMLKKCWIKDYKYAFECTGFDVSGYQNVHVHIRITCNKPKKPSEISRECRNSFKRLGKFMYDQKMSYDENAFIKYIDGYKKGEKKPDYDLNQELMDRIENL